MIRKGQCQHPKGDGKSPAEHFKQQIRPTGLCSCDRANQRPRVGDLYKELGSTRQKLYRHISPSGEMWPSGKKLLNCLSFTLWFLLVNRIDPARKLQGQTGVHQDPAVDVGVHACLD